MIVVSKTCDVAVRNAGNLKLFRFSLSLQWTPEENHSKSKVNTFKPSGPKTWKWMGYKNEKDCFTPSKHSHVCVDRTPSRRQLRTKYCDKEFCWDTLSSFANLYSRKKKELLYGKLQAGNWTKNNENKWIMNAKQRANCSFFSQVK